MSAKRTLGAASRSSPSLRWNSSRYSSGTRPTSRNESTWPSFIAAPFIVPSAVTICSAASRWRRSSASCLPCSPRVRLAACVPSWRAPWPAARPAMRAVRATREVGMRSFGIAGMVSGRGRRARRGRRGLRRDASARASPSGSAWASGVALGVGVGVGVRVASLLRRLRRRRRLLSSSLSRSRRELPLKNVVELPLSPPMLSPASSCEPVTKMTAHDEGEERRWRARASTAAT